jgi:hypothetical protein
MRTIILWENHIREISLLIYYFIVIYLLFVLGVDSRFRGENYNLIFFGTIFFLLIFDIIFLVLSYNLMKGKFLLFYVNSIIGAGCILYMIFMELVIMENRFFRLDILSIIYNFVPVSIFIIIFLKQFKKYTIKRKNT